LTNVVIKYVVDDSDLKKAQTQSTAAQKATDDLRKAADKAGDSFKTASDKGVQGFSGLQKAVGAVLAAGLLTKLIGEMTKLASESQKAGAVLQNALGSRSAAQQALKDLSEFAAKTPFQITQLTAAYVKLVNQGFKPTIKEMESLGDVAASTGKEFDQLVEAIIDAQTGEFERLKEFGIKARIEGDKVRFTFKGVQTQVENNSEAIRKYIIGLGQLNGVSGSMAAIAETTGGKFSNLRDNLDQILTTLGNNSSGVINAFLDLANNVFGKVNAGLNDQVEKLKTENSELNVLVGAITDTNIAEDVRSKLLSELNRKYPDFLKNLDAEKVTNEQLFTRLKDVNDQFFRKIALQAAEDKFKDTQKEILDLIDDEVEKRKEVNDIQQNASKIYSSYALAFKKNEQDIAKLEEDIVDIQNERAAKQKDLNDKLTEYRKALDFFNESNNDYFKTETKATSATKAHTVELKEQKKAVDNLEESFFKVRDQLQKAEEIDAKIKVKISDSDMQKLQEDAYKMISESFNNAPPIEFNFEIPEPTNKEKLKQYWQENWRDVLGQGIEDTNNFLIAIEQAEIDSLKNRISNLRSFYDEQVMLAGDNDRAKQDLRLKEQKDIAKIQREIADKEWKAKRNSIILSTAGGVARAFIDYQLPYALIPAAVAAAQGASQLAVADANKPRFAKGVLNLQGPGTETSDSIDAKLSKGESVMTAKQTREAFGILTDVRAGKLNDKVLKQISEGGGAMTDSRIVSKLDELTEVMKNLPKPPSIVKEGRQAYEIYEDAQGNKKRIRSKSI
jgi:hypothetical protein